MQEIIYQFRIFGTKKKKSFKNNLSLAKPQKIDTIKTFRRNLNKYGSEIKIFIIASESFINPDIQ